MFPAPPLPRRDFLGAAALAGAAVAFARPTATAQPASPSSSPPDADPALSPGIVDTFVNLFPWPFRRLKYDDPRALVAKLRRHRVVEAWAGSFEALLHKDLAGVNARLAAACREHGPGFLRPFGSVNLAWPDWEEDLRRCHEVHRMPGIRIFPGYQPFDLAHPDLPRLVRLAHERGLLLQIVFQLEDPRIHHPLTTLPVLDSRPLVAALRAVPEARVVLLHFAGNATGADLRELVRGTSACVDVSRWEGNGAVGRMIGADPARSPARLGVDRVVFGSHAPYFPLETGLLKLLESPLTPEQLHAIMHRNARRLLPG